MVRQRTPTPALNHLFMNHQSTIDIPALLMAIPEHSSWPEAAAGFPDGLVLRFVGTSY